MPKVIQLYTKFFAVFSECIYLVAAQCFFNRQVLVFCWNVVVGCCSSPAGIKYLDATFTQSIKSLGARYFVNKVTVDKQCIRVTLRMLDYVCIPYLFKYCFWCTHNNC